MLPGNTRGRIFLFATLIAIAAVGGGLWFLSEPVAPLASQAPALLKETVAQPAAPEAVASNDESQPQTLMAEVLTEPWLRIPSLEITPEEEAERAARRAASLERLSGYEKERAIILAELEQQSLKETVVNARTVWPSPAFGLGVGRGMFPHEYQIYLLHDPRFATLLYTAVHGSEEERNIILETTMATISEVLDERRKRNEGLPHDSDLAGSHGPGPGIYPLLLAEVDTEGVSLPLLLRWYNAGLGPELSDTERRALHEEMGIPPPSPDTIYRRSKSPNMDLMVAAARRISARLGQPLEVEGAGLPYDLLDVRIFRGGQWGIPVVDGLSGYELLENTMPLDTEQIMELLRERLEEQ